LRLDFITQLRKTTNGLKKLQFKKSLILCVVASFFWRSSYFISI